MTKFLAACVAATVFNLAQAEDAKPPVRLAIVGLTHDHVGGFIPRIAGRTDVVLAGIVEPNHVLATRYAERAHLDSRLFHDTLDDLLAQTNVDAVAAFTSPFDHLRIVQMCAPRHLAVMMEKPMAVNIRAARAMAAASKKYGVPILVNYGTTWSPDINQMYRVLHDADGLGDVRRMVVAMGHPGPKEVGCSAEFLGWLTDPKLNGGGAMMDFGCYGANIMTWLMDGRRPPLRICGRPPSSSRTFIPRLMTTPRSCSLTPTPRASSWHRGTGPIREAK